MSGFPPELLEQARQAVLRAVHTKGGSFEHLQALADQWMLLPESGHKIVGAFTHSTTERAQLEEFMRQVFISGFLLGSCAEFTVARG
jgi:hypothetical protein